MSIAKIKQELIDAGCDEASVNLCFGAHTDIKDITSAAQKLKFAAINKEEWDNSDKFALISKELNARISTKSDLETATQTIIAKNEKIETQDLQILSLTRQMDELSKQLAEMRELLNNRDTSIQEKDLMLSRQAETIETIRSQLRGSQTDAALWKKKYEYAQK